MKLSELTAIRHKAVDLLSRREHSRAELTKKLMQRGFVASDVQLIMEEFAEKNLQSDDRFTESYVRSRMIKGYGPDRIYMELKERGVNDEVISCYVVADDEEWCEVANRAYNKKFGCDKATSFEERMKRKQYMLRRGFTYQQIDRVVDENLSL